MAYNQTVTHFRRQNRYATSDFDLLNRLHSDFVGHEGRSQLAGVLGVPSARAARILAGEGAPNMHRLAYHYGFRPDDGSNGWRVLPMDEEPFDAGPCFQWDQRLLEYVQQVLSNPAGRPAVRELAWRLDTTERRLRDAMRRSGIRLNKKSPSAMRTRPSLAGGSLGISGTSPS